MQSEWGSPGRKGTKTTLAWWDEGGEGPGDEVTELTRVEMV